VAGARHARMTDCALWFLVAAGTLRRMQLPAAAASDKLRRRAGRGGLDVFFVFAFTAWRCSKTIAQLTVPSSAQISGGSVLTMAFRMSSL